MAFGLTATNVFAAKIITGDLTITDSRADRTYVAYQIIKGEVVGEEGNAENPLKLSNMKWGNGQKTKTANNALTEDEIAALPASNATRAVIDAYLSGIALSDSPSYTATKVEGGYKFDDIAAGWYVVKETTDTNGKDDFTSAFIVEVVGDATAQPKGSKTTVEKKVDDKNDSDSADGLNWLEKDSADYDIGDEITYTLKATIGNDLTDYTKYKLVFTDNLSEGLTYDSLVSVTIDGTQKSTSIVKVADGTYSGATGAYEEGTVKTFTIDDVLKEGAKAGSIIVIKYKAVLNANAVVGSAGNPNKVYLEYSNNPDVDTEFGKTPEDKVIVFTYKLIVNKTDANNNALKGAGFTLYKYSLTDKDYVAVGSELKGTDMTTFTWSGVDDGKYKLVETTTPDGYNTIDPIEFIVSAGHSEEADDPVLTNLTGNKEDGTVVFNKTAGSDLETNVVNNAGSVLPSTGGIGTTIFYAIGSVLVVGAGVLLISKKRMFN